MNFENLTIENAHLYLEDFDAGFKPIEKVERNPNKCEECDGDLIIANYFYTCQECGLTDLSRPYTIALECDSYIPKKSMYKRKLYCMEKLKLMNCHKISNSLKYREMIKYLSDYEDEFETVFELRALMKTNGYNRFYKFIYSIYRDIKGVKLIDLSWRDMDIISDAFVKLEWKFRASATDRKNMLSYNTMIYVILKKLSYQCCEHVLLPQNHEEVQGLIKQL